MIDSSIKYLMFDLGGVIIDLDVNATVNEMVRLSSLEKEQILERYAITEFFKEFEKGLITEQEFLTELKHFLKTEASYEELIKAWNAMLGVIPDRRIEKLRQLQNDYTILLLSNTNAIHESAFNEILRRDTGLPNLHAVFPTVYFSHKINMRKPDKEIFSFVLNENKINPAEMIFFDDTPENLHTAREEGIKVFHVTHPDEWMDLDYGK